MSTLFRVSSKRTMGIVASLLDVFSSYRTSYEKDPDQKEIRLRVMVETFAALYALEAEINDMLASEHLQPATEAALRDTARSIAARLREAVKSDKPIDMSPITLQAAATDSSSLGEGVQVRRRTLPVRRVRRR